MYIIDSQYCSWTSPYHSCYNHKMPSAVTVTKLGGKKVYYLQALGIIWQTGGHTARLPVERAQAGVLFSLGSRVGA